MWLLEIRDPARAYMLQSSGTRRPRSGLRRRHSGGGAVIGYVPLDAPRSERHRVPSEEDVEKLRSAAAAYDREVMARSEEIEARYGDLLRETAGELIRTGGATLETNAGTVEARVIPFRRDAVVLEIHYPGGRSQAQTSQRAVAEMAFPQLVCALAQPAIGGSARRRLTAFDGMGSSAPGLDREG